MYETLHKFGKNYIVFGDDSEIGKKKKKKKDSHPPLATHIQSEDLTSNLIRSTSRNVPHIPELDALNDPDGQPNASHIASSTCSSNSLDNLIMPSDDFEDKLHGYHPSSSFSPRYLAFSCIPILWRCFSTQRAAENLIFGCPIFSYHDIW